jgi:hypothetical protein
MALSRLPQLKKKLREEGHEFSTETDTEFLAHIEKYLACGFLVNEIRLSGGANSSVDLINRSGMKTFTLIPLILS